MQTHADAAHPSMAVGSSRPPLKEAGAGAASSRHREIA